MTNTDTCTRTDASGRVPLVRRLARPFVGSLAVLTLAGSLVACGTSDTDTAATSSASSTVATQTTVEDTSADTSTDTTSSSSAEATDATTASTEEVVEAANAFLATLTDDQLETVMYDYSDDDAKTNWSNLPEGMIQRNGLAMGDLTDEQKTAALAVLQAMLSDEGYEQVLEMMAADDVLAAQSTNGGGGAGGGLDWSSDNYYLALFGEPTADGSFMVQFGGHHLALDVDYSAGAITMTPEFVGIEPQTWTTDDGTTVEPLAEMKSSVFAVLSSLSDDQLADSELSMIYDDVVMGPGQDSGDFPDDGGVLVSSLSQEQQDLVTAAIREWVGDIDEDVAEEIVAEYVAAYDDTYVSWSGSTDSESEDAYFRISGPEVWIEYVHQAGVGFDGVHIHTVFRDTTSDYGSELEA